MPFVSVLMPVYNAADTVARAVESVCAQEGVDWELVVVDDGSSDGSAEVVARLAEGDPRVRLVRQDHGGIVEALNRGLGECRGEYVARMDADDVSLPGRLTAQSTMLDDDPRLGLCACRVNMVGDAANEGYRRYVEWTNALASHEQIWLNRFVESPLAHPSVVFRRELVERYGGYADGAFPEDYELWLRWLEQGVRMAKVPQVLVEWTDDDGRLSRTDDRYSYEAFYRCKAPFVARWLAANVQRPVWVWGAGRPTRKRAEHLVEHGVQIAGYIDIDPAKVGRGIIDRPVIAPEDLPGADQVFVLSYVAKIGARELIRTWLCEHGYAEERDFICCA